MIRWLVNLFKKKTKKPTVTFTLEEEEYETLKIWCAQNQIPITEWVRQQAKNSVPMDFRRKLKTAQSSGLALEAAFSQLDYIDKLAGLPEAKKVDVKQVFPEAKVEGHPCIYFSDTFPPNLSSRDCAGTCFHPFQRTKPCNFAADFSTNCRLYLPRKR